MSVDGWGGWRTVSLFGVAIEERSGFSDGMFSRKCCRVENADDGHGESFDRDRLHQNGPRLSAITMIRGGGNLSDCAVWEVSCALAKSESGCCPSS